MLFEFLDKTGLSRLWELIVAKIEAKTSSISVDNLTAGETNSTIPSELLPPVEDEVQSYANFASFPDTGENGAIYIDRSANKTYIWTGLEYAALTTDIAADTALNSTSTNPVQNKVITAAIEPMLIVDTNDATQGEAADVNADLLGGLPASSYITKEESTLAQNEIYIGPTQPTDGQLLWIDTLAEDVMAITVDNANKLNGLPASSYALKRDLAASGLITDETLTVSGAAADSLVVGDNLTEIRALISSLQEALENCVKYNDTDMTEEQKTSLRETLNMVYLDEEV